MTGPAHLTDEQLEELEREIDDEIERLEGRIRATGDAVRPVELDPGAVGRLSRMDEMQNQAMAKNLRHREQARLADLERARERMRAGTYGTCASCGGAIPYARFEAYPETTTCVACPR